MTLVIINRDVFWLQLSFFLPFQSLCSIFIIQKFAFWSLTWFWTGATYLELVLPILSLETSLPCSSCGPPGAHAIAEASNSLRSFHGAKHPANSVKFQHNTTYCQCHGSRSGHCAIPIGVLLFFWAWALSSSSWSENSVHVFCTRVTSASVLMALWWMTLGHGLQIQANAWCREATFNPACHFSCLTERTPGPEGEADDFALVFEIVCYFYMQLSLSEIESSLGFL